jgi:hypothetical protein
MIDRMQLSEQLTYHGFRVVSGLITKYSFAQNDAALIGSSVA